MTPLAIPESSIGGLVLLCDEQGVILEVLQDTLGLELGLAHGSSFTHAVLGGSLGKALSFLAELKTKGCAYDWEINFAIQNQVHTLHFAGGQMGSNLLIVGAEKRELALQLFERMFHVLPEHTDPLNGMTTDRRYVKDDGELDEVSRLNNELISMQRELAKKNAELEHLNQEKNRFLGMAAHDLRNPLHAILICSEFILEGHAGEKNQEFLETIHSTSLFMSRLVDDLLDVAKIEAGHLDLNLEPLNLVDFFQRRLTILHWLAIKKQIEIEMQIEPMPVVWVDESKLGQVFDNLVSNAIKFSPPRSLIRIHGAESGDNMLLQITDQGPGISTMELSRLFQPFRRGSATPTAGEKSTGLGLVIAKRIVEGHGGKIWVESQMGVGTTFYVSIPLHSVKPT